MECTKKDDKKIIYVIICSLQWLPIFIIAQCKHIATFIRKSF
jgi:hypothetical protein